MPLNLPPTIESRGVFEFIAAAIDTPKLGPCCACNQAAATIIVTLNRLAPMPTTGWGCVVCQMYGGAQVVVCRACFDAGVPVRFACRGRPNTHGRIPIAELVIPFDHRRQRHPELKSEEPSQC